MTGSANAKTKMETGGLLGGSRKGSSDAAVSPREAPTAHLVDIRSGMRRPLVTRFAGWFGLGGSGETRPSGFSPEHSLLRHGVR